MVRRRRGRRLVLAAAGLVVLIAVGWFCVWPIASGRTDAPVFSRQSAERALEKARQADAARWAPSALEQAERHMREAWTELRRQDTRIVFRRDYRPALAMLTTTEAAATTATEEADVARLDAAGQAEVALAQARRLLDETEGFLEAARFGHTPAALVRRARIHVGEAASYRQHDEHALARLRAEQALGELREARKRMLDAVERFIDPHNLQRWRDWSRETVAWSRRTGQPAIVVDKDAASLTLFVGGRAVQRYSAEIGRNHLVPKLRAGDAATPEGRYNVISKKTRGHSKYHAALELDYPNADDLTRFRQSKASGQLGARDRPGTLIEIHGHGGRGWDWTDGCVAVRDQEVEKLLERVRLGTPVTIVGSQDGTGGRFSTVARRLADGDDDDRHDP